MMLFGSGARLIVRMTIELRLGAVGRQLVDLVDADIVLDRDRPPTR